MVVRIAGYGYQKGFGGHFHNDNAVAVLRDIPGLVIASPARPDDAAGDAAHVRRGGDGRRHGLRVPRADRAVPHARPARGGRRAAGRRRTRADGGHEHVPIGAARIARDGDDLTIVTWGNGLLPVAARRRAAAPRDGHRRAGSLDLRWLAPLPVDEIVRARRRRRPRRWSSTRRAAPAASARRSSPRSSRPGFAGPARAASPREDSFVPLGDAASLVLVSEDEIVDAVHDHPALTRRQRGDLVTRGSRDRGSAGDRSRLGRADQVAAKGVRRRCRRAAVHVGRTRTIIDLA